ncbi:MAG TPA: pseudouridine synthase [Gammaproteobacteria bacterium]
MTEKLQKVLARQGFGSRREIERWIAEGRIAINERVAGLGDRISGEENIKLDGKLVRFKPVKQQLPRVIAYHKDVGTVCSRVDPEGRRNVFEDFPKIRGGRWILVGRLDINTTGLLLATTDGELANRLMHPKYAIKREYAVRIYGDVTTQMLQNLLQGVELEDGMARFEVITELGGEAKNHWFTVVLHEGRNREVRRLWESQGVQVNRLARNLFATVSLPRRLKKGHCEELTREQIEELYASVQLASPFAQVQGRNAGRSREKAKTAASKKAPNIKAESKKPLRKPNPAKNTVSKKTVAKKSFVKETAGEKSAVKKSIAKKPAWPKKRA